MVFDPFTRALLEQHTTCTPLLPDDWYGPWTSILTTLFPPPQGYVVNPRKRHELEDGSLSDLIFDIFKVTFPLTFRTLLIVEIKGSHHWDHGIPAFMQEIGRQTVLAFLGNATHKVYWIGTIGPHWIYGEKEDDDQAPRPLIGWHDVTHDDASYRDLLQLVELVDSL
ncbi:hypothetical protein DFH94DRAFT_109872 [Russula ochroleuca]|jgi:hypothetical protein|uniref:Uncharacterized protein n=1 Tax=Russula ochroleuca TaxID=152965 RepID=A0A9P5T653_9AGAM|nr:hypothetical protein DFH94DRAFT_109872 [Russula ochroleuca]